MVLGQTSNGGGWELLRWVISDCVICFVYLGLGREEMKVQGREERKIKKMLIGWELWGGWVRTVHREERRDEMRVQRGKETKIKKKSWLGGSKHSPKKLISEFNFITEVPSKTSVYCLKSASATFQNMLFKHGFWSNNFQTTLFWTPWPNTFFQILDTCVQCLNTTHCVLKRQTKRPHSNFVVACILVFLLLK